MKVIFISEGPNACGLYRAEHPVRYLHLHGIQARLSHVNASDEEMLWADVIVLQKQMQLSTYRRMKDFQNRGKKIVYDLDDDVWNLPSWNAAHIFFQRAKHSVGKFLSLCDAATVSTAPLAQQVVRYNRNVHVLPNSIDFGELDREGPLASIASPLDKNINKIDFNQFQDRCSGKVVLAWFGSPTHKRDLQILVPVLDRVCRQFPHQVVVVMGGCAERRIVANTQYDQLMFLEMVPPRVYNRYLAALGFTVGLAPVVDHVFNHSKSNLKVIEYMAAGAVPIASNIVTYNTTIRNGQTGFLCRTTRDWVHSIRRVVEDPVLRDEIRHAGQEYVRTMYDIRRTVSKWATVYKSLERP